LKIGLLGGTFDPIHTGHLVLAQECWSKFSLDKVIFIPAYQSPLKKEGDSASPEDRVEMVRLAIEGDKRFELSTYEVDKGDTSYTIDTIEHYKEKLPEGEIYFLTGSDSMEELSSWKEPDRVLSLTTFVIASRPGWSMDGPYADRVKLVIIPRMDVSSTMIRDRVSRSEPIDYLVPGLVANYIKEKGIYK